MSQFKSRIPGSTPFTTTGSDQGYCCSNTGDGTYTTSTRYECFLKNGFFIAGLNEIDAKNLCPKVQKGACCVYNTTSPYTLFAGYNGVTYCHCKPSNYGNKFTTFISGLANTCPANKTSLAPLNGACCYWKLDGGFYINVCESTDNIEECQALHQGEPEGLKYSFYVGESCITDKGNISCNSGRLLTAAEQSAYPDCKTNTLEDCFINENVLGNCCTPLNNGSRQCSITTQRECTGFWTYLGAIKGCSGSTLCSGVYFPEKINNSYYPTTASISVLTGTTNPLEKLPGETGLYQGGLYVGIFEPGSTINISGSMVYGNTTTGTAKQYRARGTGLGTNNKKWILIAAPSDTNINQGDILDPEKGSSFYDGFYNTDLKNVPYASLLRNIEINGFSDWYIPSQDELAFFFNTVSSGFSVSGYTALQEKYYLTSTNYGVGYNNTLSKIGDRYFVYCQSAVSNEYGKVILMPQDKLNCNVRLFRRIYLGS